MILQPFFVSSRGKRWRFMDSAAISSDEERGRVQQISLAALELMQEDAKCAALGVCDVGNVANIQFGVYDEAQTLSGVLFLGAIDYRSGPWADLTDWQVTSADPVVLHARPMPGFFTLSLADSLDLSIDGAHYLLAGDLQTVDGFSVTFERLSWAIYKDRTDRNSRAMRRVHDYAQADSRLAMTEAADPKDRSRTLVDIGLA